MLFYFVSFVCAQLCVLGCYLLFVWWLVRLVGCDLGLLLLIVCGLVVAFVV